VTGLAHGDAAAMSVVSPPVRLSNERISPAVGNSDVFSAAFVIETLRRTQGDSPIGAWPGKSGFYDRDSNLVDILYQAVGPEAWVVKSGGGGYLNFPFSQDIEQWRHNPPVIESSGHIDGESRFVEEDS
jgi:hypothetical protein